MVVLAHDNWFEISSHLNIQDKFALASVCRASRIQPELALLQEYEKFAQENEFGAKTMAYLLKATEAFPALKRVELIFNEVKRCCPSETKLNIFNIPQEMQKTAFRQTKFLIRILNEEMRLPNLCKLPNADKCKVKDLNLVTEWLVNHEKEISSVTSIFIYGYSVLFSDEKFITLPSELSLFKNLKELRIMEISENQTLTGVPYEIKNHGIYFTIDKVSDFKIDSNGAKDWRGIEAWKKYVEKPFRFHKSMVDLWLLCTRYVYKFNEKNFVLKGIVGFFYLLLELILGLICFLTWLCINLYELVIKEFTVKKFSYSLEF